MPTTRYQPAVGPPLLLLAAVIAGCHAPSTLPKDSVRGTRVASPEFVNGPAPLRTPSPAQAIGSERFEDSLTGGRGLPDVLRLLPQPPAHVRAAVRQLPERGRPHAYPRQPVRQGIREARRLDAPRPGCAAPEPGHGPVSQAVRVLPADPRTPRRGRAAASAAGRGPVTTAAAARDRAKAARLRAGTDRRPSRVPPPNSAAYLGIGRLRRDRPGKNVSHRPTPGTIYREFRRLASESGHSITG